MSFHLWQRGAQAAIASTRRVLRADEVPQGLQAQALCEQLDALYREQRAIVAAAGESARAEGYAQGHEQGLAEARRALAQTQAALEAQAAAERERLRADLAALALAVVRRLMGRLGDDERLAGLADGAAREWLAGGDAARAPTLVVHPAQLDAVRDRLAALPEDPAVPSPAVRADPEASLQTCRLETEAGSLDASLDVQLSRLAQAWGVPPGDAP